MKVHPSREKHADEMRGKRLRSLRELINRLDRLDMMRSLWVHDARASRAMGRIIDGVRTELNARIS
jgi:hypothetical protein